jgi:hypothetical protein
VNSNLLKPAKVENRRRHNLNR